VEVIHGENQPINPGKIARRDKSESERGREEERGRERKREKERERTSVIFHRFCAL
jgi:hypothetical protein